MIDPTNIPQPLYDQIKALMPIFCVDLLIVDEAERILMVYRNHEPAKDEWWVPGGRVFFGESRIDAARRKLLEECGLRSDDIQELFTDDCLLAFPGGLSHGISTFYKIRVSQTAVVLDRQSRSYAWKTYDEWKRLLHGKRVWPFVEKCFAVDSP